MSVDQNPYGLFLERIVDEYEQLIELAQSSTQTIDAMERELDRSRAMLFIGLLLTFALIIVPFAVYTELSSSGSWDKTGSAGLGLLFGVASSMILATISMYLLFIRTKRIRQQRKALLTEIELHQRMISLVDEQKKRVESLSGVSSIKRATLEMKVMRLNRQNL